jgi:2-oxoglutarate dehydrogenase E1 component
MTGTTRHPNFSQEADPSPRETMTRQEANEQFQLTSFLDGANAAYIEQLAL